MDYFFITLRAVENPVFSEIPRCKFFTHLKSKRVSFVYKIQFVVVLNIECKMCRNISIGLLLEIYITYRVWSNVFQKRWISYDSLSCHESINYKYITLTRPLAPASMAW